MSHPLGSSRNVVTDRYALFTPDGLVPSIIPGWSDATCHILISQALGARFTQTLVSLEPKGGGIGSTGITSILCYVLSGKCKVNGKSLSRGGFAYLPPDTEYRIAATDDKTQILLFQKPYVPLAGHQPPDFIAGNESKVEESFFLGDPHARLKQLLPDSSAFDMAVNIFTYDPGATLPFVETHIMEHGLLMLEGAGIYRLDADWHPVQAGDVIWMGPYCPQWFVATGPNPARYIYYKDVNRSPL